MGFIEISFIFLNFQHTYFSHIRSPFVFFFSGICVIYVVYDLVIYITYATFAIYGNSVIYVGEDPYFTTTLEQMWHCRGLVYLFLMSISHRFALELSSAMQDFLVEILPSTLLVSGEVPFTEPLAPAMSLAENS